jgi:tetratricopeptide (TPR) repeat protein
MYKTSILLILSFLIVFNVYGQTPESAVEYLKISYSQLQKGNLDEALTSVNKAIELDPKLADAFAVRSAIYNRKGEIEKVLADYSKIIELTPNAPDIDVYYNNRGMILLQKGDIEGAVADLNKAISINPKAAELYQGRAIIRLQKRDFEGSIADYEKALEINPNFIPSLLGRGYFRYQKGDFGNSLVDLNKAIQLKPDYAHAIVTRGIVHGLKGEIKEAIADFKRAFAINPATISDKSRGRFSSPFIELNQFIEAHPKNARGFEMRGIFRLLQKNIAEAEADFQKSLEMDKSLKSEIKEIRKEFK